MKKQVAIYITELLAEHGLTDVFTVTGGGAMFLNHAFGMNSDIKCTYNHHEQASAIAAEGYARLSGRTAAVCVTSGPGGINAMTGVLGAYLDSIPMIVISGQVKYETTVDSTGMTLRQFGDQEYDICQSVSNMTKYCAMVKDAGKIKYIVKKALYEATHGRKGPCWIDVPLDIQSCVIETDELEDFIPNEIRYQAEDSQIAQLIEKLSQSERPVILAGSGIRLGNAHDAFTKLVDKLKIPVTTAWNAHDNIWDSHPLYAGRPGTVGDRPGNFVLQKSDFMLILGCRMNIRQISYNYKNFAPDAYKVMVDIDKMELEKPSLRINLPVHADAADVIDKLLGADITYKHDHSEWIKWCRDVKVKYPIFTEASKKSVYGVNVYHFLHQLFENLDEGADIITSNGSACVCTFQAAVLKKDQRLFTNSGCASMGYGLPAAIGGSISRGGSKIICLEGDGSLQMNIQELQTVVHYQLPIKLFVINNNGYLSIRQTQSNIFKDDPMFGVDEDTGVSFPDLKKIAKAYGIRFIRIDGKETMDAQIQDALAGDEAVIIEVICDYHQGFEPKLASIRRDDGTIYSPPPYDLSPLIPDEELKAVLGIEREKR